MHIHKSRLQFFLFRHWNHITDKISQLVQTLSKTLLIVFRSEVILSLCVLYEQPRSHLLFLKFNSMKRPNELVTALALMYLVCLLLHVRESLHHLLYGQDGKILKVFQWYKLWFSIVSSISLSETIITFKMSLTRSTRNFRFVSWYVMILYGFSFLSWFSPLTLPLERGLQIGVADIWQFLENCIVYFFER